MKKPDHGDANTDTDEKTIFHSIGCALLRV
jgi:hypothetical protein